MTTDVAVNAPGREVATYDAGEGVLRVPTQVSGVYLTFSPEQRVLNDAQMVLLAPLGIEAGWDPRQVAVFLMECQERGLNPWSREVYLMSLNGKLVRHIGIDGLRKRGESTGAYRGRTTPLFSDEDEKWREVWPYKDKPPYAAKVGILRSGFDAPVYTVALYDEYRPLIDESRWDPEQKRKVKTGRKVPSPNWRVAAEGGKPTVMLAKCLPGRATIPTRNGLLPIGKIVRDRMQVDVLSVDLATGRQVYRPIVNWHRNPGTTEWVQLRAYGRFNRSQRMTPDHPVWTPAGWVNAGDLKPGDLVAMAGASITKAQHQILLGGLLGDGYLHGRRRATSVPMYVEAHAIKQESYLGWKASALANLDARVTYHMQSDGAGGVHPIVRMRTGAAPALLRYRDMKPVDLLADLDDLGVAVWLMDDGSLKSTGHGSPNPYVRIYPCAFGAEFADAAAAFLINRYGVTATVCQRERNPYLRLGSADSAKLLDRLAPYVTYDPSVNDKRWVAASVDPGPRDSLVFVPLTSAVRHTVAEKEGRYDIEVADTHTFVTASGLVVSNCAEGASWRVAFPERFGGLYVPEETEHMQREAADAAAEKRRAARAAAQRETIVVEAEVAEEPGTPETPKLTDTDRPLLLAELDEQAEVLGKTVDDLCARWVQSHNGRGIDAATVDELADHVHRIRPYVLSALRDANRDEEADVYTNAPGVATIRELFGRGPAVVDPTDVQAPA